MQHLKRILRSMLLFAFLNMLSCKEETIAPENNKGTLIGKVTQGVGGPAIEGVTVKSDAGDFTVTNALGYYSFTTASGARTITIAKEGYFIYTGTVTIAFGSTVTLNGVLRNGPSMIFVQGGTFRMGGTAGEPDEQPVHTVTLSSFYIGKYEVTQQEWVEIMGSNPSYSIGNDRPVEQVSWYDAVNFCNQKSTREGLTQAYIINGSTVTVNWSANGYRLPTEAEWEFAARGGNKSNGYLYSGGEDIDTVAWYWLNTQTTEGVGYKLSNELGIYDMSGNLWEWCWDWYGTYTANLQTNPTGPYSGTFRVSRGGGWSRDAEFCRVTNRDVRYDDRPRGDLGFRLLRTE